MGHAPPGMEMPPGPGMFDLSKPPPGFGAPLTPPPEADLIPKIEYYELPAGLMVPLVKVGFDNYIICEDKVITSSNNQYEEIEIIHLSFYLFSWKMTIISQLILKQFDFLLHVHRVKDFFRLWKHFMLLPRTSVPVIGEKTTLLRYIMHSFTTLRSSTTF